MAFFIFVSPFDGVYVLCGKKIVNSDIFFSL